MGRPRSDVAPRIVEAARERFLQQGVDGASLREIAREANTSIGMIYYYYPTKDDLLLAVLEDVYAAFSRDLSRALVGDAPVEERIRRFYARVAAMSEDEFTVVRIVLREALVSSARLKKVFARFTAEGGHVQAVSRALLEGMQAGVIRADVHPLVALALSIAVGFMPVVARRLAQGALPELELPEPGELAANLTRALLHGIGAAEGR
jgi:AcrR family transcriptional regulator